MQLSALLLLIPLAAALPQVVVDAQTIEAQILATAGQESCQQQGDDCYNKCKPSFNPLTYMYCTSKCNAAQKWCVADGGDSS
ncbi:hypothetical protein V8C35DRAFT_317386 [Trichoderma chlorosporum]